MALPDKVNDPLPLATATLRPYLAPLLLERDPGATGAGFLADLVRDLTGLIKSTEELERSPLKATDVEVVGTMSVQTLQYAEGSSPSWAAKDALQDITFHLIVVATVGDLAAICTSDAGLRAKLERTLTAARPLPRALVERAFVGDRASVMWLNGIHSPIDAKPNAKTLSGSALEFALDPLGDQSFYYSAVRSRVTLPGGTTTMVGAAPGSGRIWLNRPKTWADFIRDLAILFETLASPPAAQTKFLALAQAVSDLTDVKQAYAMTLLAPELQADQEADQAEREKVSRWTEKAEFDVEPGAGASFAARVRIDGQDLGRVVLTVAPDGDNIVAKPAWDAVPAGDKKLRAEGSRLFADRRWLKVYYDSGHALSQGRCYASAYRDQPFDWTFKDFTNYEIKDEKPKPHGTLKLPDAIAEPKKDGTMDDSLFAFVVDTYGQDGWLACDDGAMEVADFVHVAHDNTVSLIHVKGSKSKKLDRAVSVSNYEVVVGQAVKNLRHLQSKTLYQELDRGKNKQIGTAVWCDGKKVLKSPGVLPRAAMVARMRLLPANARRVVVVLQPQLTKGEHVDCLTTADRARSVRMKQLDTLMLSARLSCMAVGADFVGMAADGPLKTPKAKKARAPAKPKAPRKAKAAPVKIP